MGERTDAGHGECWQCGHDNGPHQINGYPDEQLGFPVGGWRTCPVEGCECYATWSIPAEQVEQLRELKRARD